MEKQLLTETLFSENIKLSTEIVNKKGNYYILGEHALLDEPNANSRIYKSKIVEREVKKLKEEGSLERRNIIAQLEHPKDENNFQNSFLNGCAAFCDMWIDTSNGKKFLFAKSIILDENFYGKELLGLLKKGVKVGASTRAIGSLIPLSESTKEGEELFEITDDFQLFTIDYVSNPSSGAYINNYIVEHKNNINQKKVYLTVSDKLVEILNNIKYKIK